MKGHSNGLPLNRSTSKLGEVSKYNRGKQLGKVHFILQREDLLNAMSLHILVPGKF